MTPAAGRLVGGAQGLARGELGIEGGCELERDSILDSSRGGDHRRDPRVEQPGGLGPR